MTQLVRTIRQVNATALGCVVLFWLCCVVAVWLIQNAPGVLAALVVIVVGGAFSWMIYSFVGALMADDAPAGLPPPPPPSEK